MLMEQLFNGRNYQSLTFFNALSYFVTSIVIHDDQLFRVPLIRMAAIQCQNILSYFHKRPAIPAPRSRMKSTLTTICIRINNIRIIFHIEIWNVSHLLCECRHSRQRDNRCRRLWMFPPESPLRTSFPLTRSHSSIMYGITLEQTKTHCMSPNSVLNGCVLIFQFNLKFCVNI